MNKQEHLPTIDAATLVGLACKLGALRAIEFSEFATSCNGLSDEQKKLLYRGWLAVGSFHKDASLEASDVQMCLTALRQAWLKLEATKSQNTASSYIGAI